MGERFAKGDLALCINAKPDKADPLAHMLVEGRAYRVGNAGTRADGVYCLAFHCLPSDEPGRGWGWSATRFRKIKAPHTDIADRIRACRPVRQEQPA